MSKSFRFAVYLLLLLMVSDSSLPIQLPKVMGTGSTVGTNLPIVGETSPDRQQVEPTIAVDPRNPSIIIAGAQDLRLKAAGGHRWHGYYRSTDGGQTWSSELLPGFPGDTSAEGIASPLHHSNATSDPVIAFDNHGSLYYAGLVFNVTSTGIGNTVLFVAKYLDDGATYAGTTLITGPLFADKEWIAVDNTGGPFDGRVYLAFDANLTSTSYFATMLTRSSDGGRTWSSPFYTPADQTGELPGVTVGSNGDVYVSSDAFDALTGAPLGYIQVSKITNGGTYLAQNVRAVDPASLEFSIPGGSFRAATIPQIAADKNGVYLVWDDLRAGNVSVFITRSTDAGSSWTSPLRVNDTPDGQHFFPTITTTGEVVGVAWYDSRLNVGSSITSLDVFYSQSQDSGLTFSQNVRVTSVSFNPEVVERTDAPNFSEPFIGDYFEISASATVAHVIWIDNRSACDSTDLVFGCVDQDLYTSTIQLNPVTPSYDVGIYGLSTDTGFAYSTIGARNIRVSLTATNLGSTQESFLVVFTANSTVIGEASVVIAAGASQIVNITWNARSMARGSYRIAGDASVAPGETNLGNNVAFDPVPFLILLGGDVNGDCRVNILDLVTVSAVYGSSIGHLSTPTWNPLADLNNDGRIDMADLSLFGTVFGQSC